MSLLAGGMTARCLAGGMTAVTATHESGPRVSDSGYLENNSQHRKPDSDNGHPAFRVIEARRGMGWEWGVGDVEKGCP